MAEEVEQTREQLRKSKSKCVTLQICSNGQLQSKPKPTEDQLESNIWKNKMVTKYITRLYSGTIKQISMHY